MTYQNRRLVIILIIAFLVLLVPLLAMQFINEVNWALPDFVIAGILLFGTGLLVEIVLRKVKKLNYRFAIIVAIVLLLLLIWAELAVGIFGTPFAGS